MSPQPSPQPEHRCCVCDDEFSNERDLAAHLIQHAEERQFQDEINDNGILYEEPVATTPQTPYKSFYPEYTTMDFEKTEDSNTEPPRSRSPVVFDIDSDSDDDSASKSKQVVPAPVTQPLPQPVQQLNFNSGSRKRGRHPGRRGQ